MNRTRKNHGKLRVHPAAIQLLTDATWDFTLQLLWGGCPFTPAETELAKAYIRQYYQSIPPEQFTQVASRRFSTFCQRVLLAKRYVDRSPYRYIPHPCIWLDPRNPKGFAGTRRWLEDNKRRKRQQMAFSSGYGIPFNPFYHFSA